MDGYDPTEHRLPADLRQCQCGHCASHDRLNRGDVSRCTRPFRLSVEGTQCSRCDTHFCELCSHKCFQCMGPLCLACDGCDTCEQVLCVACHNRKYCNICRAMCCDDAPRCEFAWRKCDTCDFVLCDECDFHREGIFFGCDHPQCDKYCCGACLSVNTVFPCELCRYWYCEDCREQHNAFPCDE